MRASETRTMSRTPCARIFFGMGSIPHSGMPRPAERPRVLKHEDGVGRHGKRRIVDPRVHVVEVTKHHCGSGMLEQPAIRGRVLDDGAVRRQIAAQHRHAPFGSQRPIARDDHFVVHDDRIRDVLPQRPPVHCEAVHVQQIGPSDATAREVLRRSRNPPSGIRRTDGCWPGRASASTAASNRSRSSEAPARPAIAMR